MSYQKRLVASAVLLAGVLFAGPGIGDVTLTRLANDGIILSNARTRVMVDGMVVEPYSIYGGLPAETQSEFMRATGAFGQIDLALVSHRHHDHNQPAFACEFMRKSLATRLVTSSEVVDLMREKCRSFVLSSNRIEIVDPQPGQPVAVELDRARVTVFRLSHGKRKYASIKHFGHLVEMGGVKVLHIGDAAMDPADFEAAGFADMDLDAVLVPVWFFQPGPGAEIVRRYLDAPLKIAVQVPPVEMEEARAFLAADYPDVRLPGPLETIRLAPRQR